MGFRVKVRDAFVGVRMELGEYLQKKTAFELSLETCRVCREKRDFKKLIIDLIWL